MSSTVIKSVMNPKNLRKLVGKQDAFYFEPSKLLPSDATSSKYANMYAKIPVVAVLGWAGAQDHHLQKYSNIYSELGYHIIRFSPSIQLSFFVSEATHTTYSVEFMELFNKHNLCQNRLLVHLFSNASGFIIYQHVLKETNQTNSRFRFIKHNQVGVIYDSAPGMPGDLFGFISAILDLTGNFKFGPLKYFTTSFLVVYFKAYFFFTNYFVGFLQQIKESEEPSALYIYSKADKLISATNIAKHIAEKRVRFPNAYLKSHVYEDAEHTMIYMKYPESYLSHIKEHLNVCQLNLEGFLHENAKVTKAKL